MPGPFDALPLLFAQAQNAPGGGGANQGSGTWTFFIYVAIIGLWFYILLLRPQQKQEKQRKAMLQALKKNDKVVTSAGIYGTVVSIEDGQDRVVLRVDDDRGIRIAFTRASIVRVLDGQDKDKDKVREKEKAAESA
jgi:preprotein translocase subunit YajC